MHILRSLLLLLRPKGKAANPRLLIIGTILLIAILFFSWFYQFPLYITDRYSWHTTLGNRYFLEAKPQKAIEHADKAIQIANNKPDAYELKIRICFMFERYDCINKTLESLAGIEKSAYYYMQEGVLEFYLGNIKMAIAYYERSMEINSSFAPAYVLLGFALLEKEDFTGALANFDKSAGLVPNRYAFDDHLWVWVDAMTHAGYSLLYENKGESQKATEEMNKAIKISKRIAQLGEYLLI